MFEYKVLTQRDEVFAGRFDPEVLETTLNSHAGEGWRLTESFVAFNVWKSLKSELVLILERPQADAES